MTTDAPVTRPLTPCIGICSTSIGDSVCRGCKRFNHEVYHWNSYSDDQKHNVLARLDSLLVLISQRYFSVTDEARLNTALASGGIRSGSLYSAEAKAFALLRTLQQRDPELTVGSLPDSLGFTVSGTRHGTLREMFHRIDQEYHELSLAYFDANFRRAPR